MTNERKFTDTAAVRSSVPLLIGLVGPSGSGKTKSALRLASGMLRVTGGDLHVIDTEARRALHYADDHKFRHVEFLAPFGPLDYWAAVSHSVAKGAKVIIIDSASHMHEGPGGTLETHESECERLAKAWNASRDKVQMAAWQRPKSELRRFLNALLQVQCHFIFCFRAKEKVKLLGNGKPQAMGFQPIAGDEMVYEQTLNCLLHPNSGGVPSWQPEEMGERAIIKLPGQFHDLFRERRPLDEDTGEALARWAAGAEKPKAPAAQAPTNGGRPPLVEYATADQKTEFFAKAKSRFADQTAARAWFAEHAQTDSTERVSKATMGQLIEMLDAMPELAF